MTKLEEIKLSRPKISDAARREVESTAEATEAIGNKEDRIYSETLRFLLREHDRAHVDRAWLIAEVERLNALDVDALRKIVSDIHATHTTLKETRADIDRAESLLAAERAKVAKLHEALVELLNAVDTHDKANGKIMVDRHATANARAVSAEVGGES